MSSVEAGAMSAVETGQMSAAEPRQMCSVARTDICLFSILNVQVSEVSLSQYHNVQVSDRRSGPTSAKNCPKWVQNGRQVLRIDPCESPSHFIASRTGFAPKIRQNVAQTLDQPPPAAATCRGNVSSSVFFDRVNINC